jgi:hypothetical protein
MAYLGQNFDANNVEPAAPIDVISPGDYLAQIVRSDMKDTKDSQGKFLELEFDILEGEYQGRKLWARLNLVNRNEKAQQIAQRELSAICHATGQIQISDSEALHFKPLVLTVHAKPAGPDKGGVHREAQNEIKGYAPAGGAPRGGHAAQPQASTQQGAAPAGNVPAWRRAKV